MVIEIRNMDNEVDPVQSKPPLSFLLFASIIEKKYYCCNQATRSNLLSKNDLKPNHEVTVPDVEDLPLNELGLE